jgi:hypothetical protein
MPSLTPSRIILRHSNVSGEKPVDSDLLLGEIYINIPDNKLYYKNRDDLVNPIVEINLTTSDDLIHVRDVNLSNDGDLIATYSNNSTKSLGNVIGPDGRGLAIDGVVDYVNQLPTSSTLPPIANILNKNGTLFIVRLGASSGSPFSPTGPRIYSYNTSSGGTWSELTGATVAASGADGADGNTIISGTISTPSGGADGDYYLDRINYVLFGPKSAGAWPSPGVSLKGPNSLTVSTTSDGTAVLDIDSVETNDITIADAVTFNNATFNYGSGVATAHRTALGLSSGTATINVALLGVYPNGSITLASTNSGGVVLLNGQLATDSRSIGFPNASGTVALTASPTGVPDKLTNGTVAGTLTINSMSYTYGTGAAAAHRTALGLGTAATSASTAFAAASHSHGSITAAGAIGSASDQVVTTTTNGLLTTSSRSGIDSRDLIEYRLNTSPSQLDPADSGKILLLQYGDSVWFKDNTDTTILLAGSGDQGGGSTYTLTESSIVGGTYGAFTGSNTVTVHAGTYTVTISASNFITSSWGSHNINLRGTPNYGAIFSGGTPDTLYLLQPDTANENLSAQFALADPSSWPNQSGTISVTVTEETEFYLEGNLPNELDMVDITVTFE